MPREYDRRDVLERAAGLAGCSESPGTGTASEGPGTSASSTATPTDSPTPTPTAAAAGAFVPADWAPAVDVLGVESTGYGVLKPAALAPDADALGREYYEDLVAVRGLLDVVGVDPESVATHVAVEGGSAHEGPFDPETTGAALADGGYEPDGSREGFDLYVPTQAAERTDRVVAVSDGVLVVGRDADEVTPRDAAAAVVDAGVGAAERLVDAEPAMATLAGQFEGADLAMGAPRDPPSETNAEYGQFADNSAFGYKMTVDGDETTLSIHHVFTSADAADGDAVQRWVDASGETSIFGIMESVEVTADGVTVTTSGTLSTGVISETPLGGVFVSTGSRSEESVQAGASVEVDDADTVEVTWTSNQNAEYLSATFESDTAGVDQRRLDDVGESTTYEGDDGETVQVTVTAHAGDRSTVILEKSVSL